MTDQIEKAMDKAHGMIVSERTLFGIKAHEALSLGLMLTGVVTAMGNINEWHEVLHPHRVLGGLMAIGSVVVQMATGRVREAGTSDSSS